jgi:hypothetical protein
MVNIKSASIFNGFFESKKSAGKAEISPECTQKYAGVARVYHAAINHDRALREANALLNHHAPGRTIGCTQLRGRILSLN